MERQGKTTDGDRVQRALPDSSISVPGTFAYGGAWKLVVWNGYGYYETNRHCKPGLGQDGGILQESPDQPPGGGLLVVRQIDMGKDSMIPGRQGLKTDTGLLTREFDKGSGESKIERRQKQENKEAGKVPWQKTE